ncbi:hypothetical protein Tco_0777083 [Tanacetum coccineum]
MFESGSYKLHREHVALYKALEASMERTNRDEFLIEKAKSRKRPREDQDPPPPPPKDSDQSKKKRHNSDASGSEQPPAPQPSAWKTSDTREAPSSSSKQKSVPQSEQLVKVCYPIPEVHNVSDLGWTTVMLIFTMFLNRSALVDVVPEEERLETPKPEWVIPLNDLPEPENNWANAYAKSQIGKSKLRKADLEVPTYQIVRVCHSNIISLQFQMEECHLLLIDQIDLVNPEGNWIVPDMGKHLPLGGPSGQVIIQPQFFFNKDLEYLVSGSKERRSALSISKLKAAYYLYFGLEELVPSQWIKSEREYDISAAHGITHWWFKRKEFYITSHNATSDRHAVRSRMRILSVLSIKTYERYGYTYLREIVIHRADYKEYKILEANFKNLHSNDFKDLYLLQLQGKLNHVFGAEKVHLFNVVNLWIRNIVIRKRVEDLQLGIENRNDQKKMMREYEVHRFSDGTLTRVLDKLDYMVKDFKLFHYNPGMEIKIWSEDDKRRSEEFMEVIERRLKIRRIFRILEGFVSGRLRDVAYRLITRTK